MMTKINKEYIETVAKEHHCLNQLISLKLAFGPNATVGYVVGPGDETVRCKTVSDLIDIGWVPRKYAYLDQYLHLLHEKHYAIFRDGHNTDVHYKTKKAAERYRQSMQEDYPEYNWTVQLTPANKEMSTP